MTHFMSILKESTISTVSNRKDSNFLTFSLFLSIAFHSICGVTVERS